MLRPSKRLFDRADVEGRGTRDQGRQVSVTPRELISLIDSGSAPVILDVRSEEEFREGHVPGALLIPFNEIRMRAESIPAGKDDAVVLYCGHGPRAWIAGTALKRLGFTRVEYLRGHMRGWRKAQLRQDVT